jgi:Flp pilus assembly protein TadG
MTKTTHYPRSFGLLNRRGILREDGRSIVEFAFACAVVFGMLFGVIYFSMALYTYHYISEAAREGSRYAMVRGSTCHANTPGLTNCGTSGITSAQLQTYVQDLGYPGINAASNMVVTTTWYTASSTQPTTWTACRTGTCNAPGNIVKVQVAYTYPLSIPFYGKKTLSMTSTSQMVIAQ